MQQPVYVDTLIAINFIVDYFLLRITALLAGCGPASKRLILSAALSSLTSLMVFLPPLSPFWSVAANLALSGGIVRLAFPWSGKRTFFSRAVVFYCVNLLFAGGVFLLCWGKAPKGLLYLNGALYFQMSPLFLIGAASLLYAGTWLFHIAMAHGRIASKSSSVLLEAAGVQVRLTAYLDTANHLRDVFSGLPVVLCTAEGIRPLLGEEGIRWMKEGQYLSAPPPERAAALRLRMIPFSGMGGGGVLPAFQPDGLWLVGKDGEMRPFQAVAAIAPNPFRQGYDLLLHPEIQAGDVQSSPTKEKTASQSGKAIHHRF